MANLNLSNQKSKIKPIGLGTGTGFAYTDKTNDTKLVYLLQQAVDLGINFIDTAEIYFKGHAEELIGNALKKRRKEVFIATKVSPEHCDYNSVINSCEASLKRLQTDYIDLYQIHWPNPIIPLEETLSAFETLVQEGKIRFIGVSNFSLRQLKEAQKALNKNQIVSLQTEYNLFERSVEHDLLPYCQQNNITLIAYTPLNSGKAAKNPDFQKKLKKIASKYEKKVSQVILQWLISHSSVITIPATTNPEHLKENSLASTFKLSKKDFMEISSMFQTQIHLVDTSKIKVTSANDHSAYQTLKQALENKQNFFPSPQMLSKDLADGDFLKPIKLKLANNKKSKYKYELIGGRVRYWAWVIAFGFKKKIPAIIED